MKRFKVYRQWGIDCPTSMLRDHHYEFDVSFDTSDLQAIVVEWHETTIGSGTFTVSGIGALGGAVLNAHKRLMLLAVAHAALGRTPAANTQV